MLSLALQPCRGNKGASVSNRKRRKDCQEKSEELEFLILVSFCFFSSCALYIRPALVFLPISYFLYLFLVFRDKKTITNSIICYLIFSLPGLGLIYIWGGFYDKDNFGSNFTSDLHNYKFILENIPILLSYIAFYFFPVLFIEYLDVSFKKFFHKYILAFSFAFITLVLMSQFGLLDYLSKFTLGGGAILKLNYIIKSENYILLLIFSSIGFAIVYQIIRENYKTNISIFLPLIIISGFPKIIFQEYSEPLILLIFFFGIINTRLHEIYFRKVYISNMLVLLYFTTYLLGATYYKHFM